MSATDLTIGAPAPEFTAATEKGETLSLSSLRGKTVVLYFYPKDDTPGCTIEGIEFTAHKAQFDALGAVVLGVSADSVQSHADFCGKHALGITLLSDPDRTALIEPYGVWVEKNLYGKKSMGIARTTFVIDPQGVLSAVYKNVKAEGHAAKVLAGLQAVAAA